MRRIVILALAAAAASAQAVYTVVPNAYTSTQASTSGLNTFIRDTGNARTGQLLINSSQLGGINVGDQIQGISFRLYAGNTTGFPATAATWSNYQIFVGQGVAPNAGLTTFASNFVGTPTQVRSGALTLNPGSFSGTGAPRPFGTDILFQTPYTYTGGHLTIEIRHGGSNIVNGATDFLEVALTTDTVAGYGTNFRSFTATGDTATTGAQANFTITRLLSAPVPEPASIAALGLGAAALLRRRRK